MEETVLTIRQNMLRRNMQIRINTLIQVRRAAFGRVGCS